MSYQINVPWSRQDSVEYRGAIIKLFKFPDKLANQFKEWRVYTGMWHYQMWYCDHWIDFTFDDSVNATKRGAIARAEELIERHFLLNLLYK